MRLEDSTIEFLDLGLAPYGSVLDLQYFCHKRCLQQNINTVLFVEHEPVITIGHFANHDDFILSENQLKAQGVDIYKIDRGGKLTAHMPGQIVVYPIIKLEEFNLNPKQYIAILEKTLLETLLEFGITGQLDKDNPGIWIDHAKVAAVGVRIKNRASLHGLALNVSNQMDLFQAIVPCGLHGKTVTTIEQITQHSIDINEVKKLLLKYLINNLGLGKVQLGNVLKTTQVASMMAEQ